MVPVVNCYAAGDGVIKWYGNSDGFYGEEKWHYEHAGGFIGIGLSFCNRMNLSGYNWAEVHLGFNTTCYYDGDRYDADNVTPQGTLSGEFGVARSTQDMKYKGTYTNWDFSNVWSIDGVTNNGYPYLQMKRDYDTLGLPPPSIMRGFIQFI